jgi:hypothetical protein
MIPILSTALQSAGALAGFQTLLRRCPTAADRKRLVLAAWESRALSRRETRLLIEAGQMETA